MRKDDTSSHLPRRMRFLSNSCLNSWQRLKLLSLPLFGAGYSHNVGVGQALGCTQPLACPSSRAGLCCLPFDGCGRRSCSSLRWGCAARPPRLGGFEKRCS